MLCAYQSVLLLILLASDQTKPYFLTHAQKRNRCKVCRHAGGKTLFSARRHNSGK